MKQTGPGTNQVGNQGQTPVTSPTHPPQQATPEAHNPADNPVAHQQQGSQQNGQSHMKMENNQHPMMSSPSSSVSPQPSWGEMNTGHSSASGSNSYMPMSTMSMSSMPGMGPGGMAAMSHYHSWYAQPPMNQQSCLT